MPSKHLKSVRIRPDAPFYSALDAGSIPALLKSSIIWQCECSVKWISVRNKALTNLPLFKLLSTSVALLVQCCKGRDRTPHFKSRL